MEALRSLPGVQAVDLGSYNDQPWWAIPPLADPARFSVLARGMGRLPGCDGRGATIAIVDRTPDLLSPCLGGRFAGMVGGGDDAWRWNPMRQIA